MCLLFNETRSCMNYMNVIYEYARYQCKLNLLDMKHPGIICYAFCI